METASTELGGAGRAFLDAGRWGEALECLAAAQDQQGLEKLAAEALQAGDFFVWRHSLKLLDQDLNPDKIKDIQLRAETLGKISFARAAEALVNPPEDSQ